MNPLKLTSAVLMLALAALASGCAADDELTGTTPDSCSKDRQMTITVATSTDATTRVAYDEDKVGSAGVLTWEEGDKLTVVGFDESGSYQGKAEYTLSSEAGDTKGSFTGSEIASATKYNVYYPSTVTVDETTGAATFALSTQNQDGSNNTAHLRNNIFLQATGVTDLGNIKLDMKSSIMKFELSNVPQEVGTLKTLIWTVETADGLKSLELVFPTAGNIVTFSDGNQGLTAYLAFMPDDMSVKANGKFSVTLKGDKAYYAETTIIDGKTYAENLRYTAKIDGNSSTMEWKAKPLTVQTTVASGSNYYNGFTMEIGSWKADAPAEQITLGSAIIADGAAAISVDLSAYIGKDIWICIPKVVKFFHTLTADEASSMEIVLPDKDGGSTLKASPTASDKKYENDWIVALYMGVNKDGGTAADAVPLYWATGNLIATKTGSGDSDVAFHIATADETKSEVTTYDNYTKYRNRSLGSQWNLFGYGDASGLKTSENDGDYPDEDISGSSTYDIARVQLGGSWRLPTCGKGADNEFAAFADGAISGILPDGANWKDNNTFLGREYTHTISDDDASRSTITNTLRFPATGHREGLNAVFIQSFGYYWSGSVYGSGLVYSLSISDYSAYPDNSGLRHYGQSVCPVSE